MPKLSQVVAVESRARSQGFQVLSDAHREVTKPPLLSGISREYRPKDQEGDKLPGEMTRVQVRAEDVVKRVNDELVRMLDVVATKEAGNTVAKADLVVDNVVLVPNLPVTYLLWLKKELVSVHTFIQKLPTLDPADDWTYDQGVWKTAPVETTRTKKVPTAFVKAPATDKHPAQVDTLFEDVIVGYWKTVKFSGAMPADRVAQLLERVEKLQRAVAYAIQQANSVEVDNVEVGKKVFDYLLA